MPMEETMSLENERERGFPSRFRRTQWFLIMEKSELGSFLGGKNKRLPMVS